MLLDHKLKKSEDEFTYLQAKTEVLLLTLWLEVEVE